MAAEAYGFPATISNMPFPPSAVSISSSTNASPTVITTSSPHGLKTGQAVIINGHLVNTAANGVWIATYVTATTFKISTFAGFPGTFVNGVGVGTASGTAQSLGLPSVNLPEDAVDARDATSVNVPFEALLDMTAWLAWKVLANLTMLTGGSAELYTLLVNSTSQFSGAMNVDGGMTVTTNPAIFSVAAQFDSVTKFPATHRPADAATINLGVSPIVALTPPATSNRTVVVADSVARDWMIIGWDANVSEELSFTVQRADATVIAQCYTGSIRYSAADELTGGSLFLRNEGGVWRGVSYSGFVVTGAGW